MALVEDESKKKLKEEMKRIKSLTSSVLVGNPQLQDTTSEMISKIGLLAQNMGDTKKG